MKVKELKEALNYMDDNDEVRISFDDLRTYSVKDSSDCCDFMLTPDISEPTYNNKHEVGNLLFNNYCDNRLWKRNMTYVNKRAAVALLLITLQ